MAEYHLKAAIVRVLIDGEELVTIVRGESMTGIPATPEMHFRNGAIAISYMSSRGAQHGGLIMKVLPSRDHAMSDGAQSLDVPQFSDMMPRISRVAEAVDRSFHRAGARVA